MTWCNRGMFGNKKSREGTRVALSFFREGYRFSLVHQKLDHREWSFGLNIRIATSCDAKNVRDIYAPYVEETAITFEYETPSVEEFERRILLTSEHYPFLVAEGDGGLVGYAYAGRFHDRPAYDWAVETSIYVARSCRGSGIGRRLHEALERSLGKQGILNMCACIACAREHDSHLPEGSIDFHERLGYRMVGRFECCGHKFGRWYDVAWMEKLIGDHDASASPVVPFSQI